MKIKALQRYLRDQDIDQAVFVNLDDRRQDWGLEYFSDIRDLEYGALIVGKRDMYLATSGFEIDRYRQEHNLRVEDCGRDLFTWIASQIGERIATNHRCLDLSASAHLTQATKKKGQDISGHLIALRATKTEEELSRMRKAAKIGDAIFEELLSEFSGLRQERDVSRALKISMASKGVSPSFPPIVASGSNAAICHHVPGGRLRKGFLVMDFGVRYRGYCSDMTRTVYLGKPSAAERELYDTLLTVQEHGVSLLRPHTTFSEVDEELRSMLGHHAEDFIHSFGHSLGMDVHDPLPVASRDLVFEKAMVFTMEPGLYVRGRYGMRIEDDVVVGSKPRLLSRSPKELLTPLARL